MSSSAFSSPPLFSGQKRFFDEARDVPVSQKFLDSLVPGDCDVSDTTTRSRINSSQSLDRPSSASTRAASLIANAEAHISVGKSVHQHQSPGLQKDLFDFEGVNRVVLQKSLPSKDPDNLQKQGQSRVKYSDRANEGHSDMLRKRSQAEVLPPRAKVNDCIKKQPKHQHQKTLEVGVNIAASVSVSTKHFDAIPEHTTAKRRHKSPHPLLLRDLWEGYKLFQARENAIQLLHIFALVIPTQPSL
ncbi:predicted protein [Coccidioides posadasii str. Silveira]|uniref:Predicted protein n=1 Tax=Coccidioides posadasii (strain RMSCC 757 / Silveira) TaxID=443226 RepID=E9DHB3_COCPS|nr:predicted protein [Coccidioides posadasii str. Silveira]